MRNVFYAMTTAAALAAGVAQAADLPSRKGAPEYVAPAPIFSWAGPYVGIHGGAAIGDSSFIANLRTTDAAFLGGLTVGYNFQLTPHFVAGVEADVGYRSSFGGSNNGFAFSSGTTDGYLGTVRARLGYGQDRWLAYITGGYAFGNVIAPKSFVTPGLAAVRAAGNDTFLSGWSAGAGLEYALTDQWSVKAEYLYTQLKDENPLYLTSASGVFPVALLARSAAHVVRAGVNYHFNLGGPAPVLAKF